MEGEDDMKGIRSLVRLVVVTTLAFALSAGWAGVATAASDLPAIGQDATAYSHCGSQVREDLGTALPSSWSDMQIINCNMFAPPLTIAVTSGGWRDAGTGEYTAYGIHVFVVGSSGGWQDAGAARLVAYAPKLGMLVGGAR
jgi:hypothetical protein